MELSREDSQIMSENPHHVYSYPKTVSRADMAGELYEIKMALLLFLRGINHTGGFYLATNVDGAGAFDDVVFKYKPLDCPNIAKTCFIQLKHKQMKQESEKRRTKPLTLEALCSNSGNFSLGKYHESYCEVRQMTSSANILFSGRFDNACFVIYTNAPAEKKVSAHEKVREYFNPERSLLGSGGELQFVFHFTDETAINYKPNKELTEDLLNSKEEFLSNLCIYCGQANESELDLFLQQEVECALRTSKSVTEMICKELTSKMSDWWRNSSYVLTETAFMWQDILISQIQNVNKVVAAKLNDLGLHYSKQELDSLHVTLQNSVTVFLTTSDTKLSSLKVLDVLGSHYTEQFMFLNGESLLNAKEEILCLWRSLCCRAMAFDCGTQTTVTDLIALVTELRDISREKLLVFVVPSEFSATHSDLIKNNLGHHITYVKDSFSFAHLDDASQKNIMTRKVIFQGIPVGLADVVKESSVEISGEVIHKLLSGYRLTFGRKLEDPIPYYIPRRLKRFDRLEKNFKLNAFESEFFVISNITKEIQEILPYRRNLTRYIPNVSELTSHISIKENYSDLDFEGVCNQYSSRNLHWLKFDKNWLVWRKSKENLNLIKNNLDKKEWSTYPATNSGIEDRVVLVTAEPGMGKTTLITYLAKQIQREEPSLWIIRVNLNDTTDLLEKVDESYFSNIDNTISFLLSAILSNEKLTKQEPDFELEFLKSQLRTLNNVALLFDGFDEICPDYPDQVIALLHSLLKTNVHKLWITSRKSMRDRLQESLSLISYTLHPFTREDQHNFLTQYWKSVMNIDYTEQLSKFADLLLDLTSKSLNDKEREFTGIPLQTFMLAEAFETEMMTFISEGKVCLPQRINLLDLYERFIEKKHQLFCKEKAKYDTSKPALRREIEKLKKISSMNHMNAALVLLLSVEQLHALDSFCYEDIGSFLEDVANAEEKRGIIDGIINKKPHFIHRTFAEYFLALWLSLYTNSANTFIRNNLFTENYHIVRYFLDCILAKGYDLHNAVLSSNKEDVDSCLSEAKCGINDVDKGGRTVLHLACSYPLVEHEQGGSTVDLLLKLGSAVNVEDTLLHWTPMRYADATKLWCHVDSLLGKGGRRDDLIQTKQNLNDEDMLQEAAKQGYINLLAFVFDCGVDVNIVVNSGEDLSLLHVAADAGNVCSVDFLLGRGADFEARDISETSPLHKAAFKGHLAVVQSLVSAGANVRSADSEQATALHWAASHGHPGVVKLLVDNGANVMARTSEFITPIQLAAGNGHLDVIQYLQSQGGDIMSRDQFSTTPLQEAAERGHIPVVRYLVDNGVDIHVRDTGDTTPLHWASKNGHLPVVEYLVAKGVKVMPNVAGKTQPIHWAAGSGQLEVVKFLVQNGSDIDNRDEKDATSLMLASEQGHLDTVEYLIQTGANVNLAGSDGMSSLHLAAKKDCLSVIDCLVNNGADVNALDGCGRTPLHSCAEYGHLLVVQYLMSNGADLNVRNNLNQTPLDMSTECEQWDTVQWLIAKGKEVALVANVASEENNSPENV